MTTVWRPRVRIPVPGVDDEVEVAVEVTEEVLLTVKGHEAEESPSDERAMRARGEVSLELQGVQCLSARSSAL
jgi:HSP20 family molecular chaperone IbpA